MNTSSGAEWAYFMDAYGPAPAFLFSWVSTLVLKPSQMAIICLSFAQYAVEAFVAECDPPMAVVKMVALVAIGKCYEIVREEIPRMKVPYKRGYHKKCCTSSLIICATTN